LLLFVADVRAEGEGIRGADGGGELAEDVDGGLSDLGCGSSVVLD
jgi:hypothetical protein